MTHTSLVDFDSQEKSMNPALGRMVGVGGDYNITAGTTPTTGLLFTHIYITADAVIDDVKVNGTSVKTARHYTGTLPMGYLICAGGLQERDQISYIKLTSGSAEGIVFEV
jgi:hypothetical protein